MEEQPLISIITVVYNAEKLIEQTLQSAIEQTYKNVELVIIDGGSKDRTIEIATKFNPYIGAIVSEKDKGIFDAMNKGIQYAKGEWLYFLNAGDSFVDRNVLNNLFYGKNYPGKNLLYAKVETKNEPTGVNYISGKEINIRSFYFQYPINHQSTFARKKIFEKIGIFDLSYPVAGDLEWFARVFSKDASQTLFIDRLIAYYDIIGNSYNKRMEGYIEFIRISFRFFPLHIALINLLMYPVIWLKMKTIRTFQHTSWFKAYRKAKFNKRVVHS